MAIAWFNGRYVPESRARIPATDPAVLWGAGLFDVLHAYQGRPFRPRAHAERLARSATAFGITAKLPDFARVVPRLLARNRLLEAYVRVTVTLGGSVILFARRHEPLAASVRQRGARLEIAPWRRDPSSPIAGHKTLAYYELMLTRGDAARRGAVDALLLDPRGHVLEGARSTALFVKDGKLVMPRPGARKRGILPGVTSAVVREIARAERIACSSRPALLEELLAADEVLITSTMMEVVPIARVGRHRIGRPGPVTLRLAEAYRRLTESECVAREEGRPSRRSRREADNH